MYRLFLMGTHDENLTYFIEWNKDLVELINVQSYTEPLNGVLCVYEYYFIHVLEVRKFINKCLIIWNIEIEIKLN